MIVADRRRMRINRVDVLSGGLVAHVAGEVWQNADGSIGGCTSWHDLLIALPEDFRFQAEIKGISPLEWLKRRLSNISYITVETIV